jgi:flagellar assembly factor FliW
MKMTLPRFGLEEVEIDPNTLIEFPNGLPGLESCKQFKLFHSGDNPLIFWLQSIDDTEVVLTLTDPNFLPISYNIALTDKEQSTLQIDANDEMQIAVILFRQMEVNSAVQGAVQANFRSPVIINVSKQLALQKPLHTSEFTIDANQPLPEVQQATEPLVSGFNEASIMSSVARNEFCSVA